MRDYNHITLVGNLTKDPEQKNFGDKAKSQFIIAVNRDYKTNGKDNVDFIKISAWGKLAKICNDYLKKGKKVLVDGKLHINSFEKDKIKIKITEVVAENIKILSPKEVA
jgi:single-strand DNA-binding protein